MSPELCIPGYFQLCVPDEARVGAVQSSHNFHLSKSRRSWHSFRNEVWRASRTIDLAKSLDETEGPPQSLEDRALKGREQRPRSASSSTELTLRLPPGCCKRAALAIPEICLEKRQSLKVCLQPSQIWLCPPTPVPCKWVESDSHPCHSV
ncbi:hypothetical protein HispidOSU_023723 [Sigmodon hispidus]